MTKERVCGRNNNTMETTSLKKQSCSSFEESSCEKHIVSEIESVHWQLPLCTSALLDFAIVFPVSTEIIDTTNLSQPFGTFYQKKKKLVVSKYYVTTEQKILPKLVTAQLNLKIPRLIWYGSSWPLQ